MRQATRPVLLILVAMAVSLPAFAKQYPDVSDDGLTRVDSKRLDAVYWRDGATLAGYDKVMIGDVDVSFRKNWQRDQNSRRRGTTDRITAEDMTKIRTGVAEGFTEIFAKVLEEGGYVVVDEPGDDVLALEPSIVDLDVRAPDISMRQPGITRTYVASAGEMTLNMALFDSGSNSQIGRVIDRRRAMERGQQLQWSSSITNRQEANIMFRSWANALLDALNEAKENQG
ncbi:MAG: DUF3313 family protein [Xanthomonadales bacterium]|nr:DUF3313 family protein [Xanthomonadales bacterium]